MTNLGSVSFSDFEAAPSPPDAVSPTPSPSEGDDGVREETRSYLEKLISSNSADDHRTAVQLLICLIAKGHDVRQFAPFVVQQIASPDPRIRQLSSVFLVHYASDVADTSLLGINSLQRLLSDHDQINRASALKMISSIPLIDTIPEIQNAVELVIGDTSPYVRKEAAYAVIKAAELDPSLIEAYLPYVQRMMLDTDPIAFSGAIAAFYSLCPENVEFIHPNFRFICNNILKFDEFAQVYVMRAMVIYTRLCFKDPETVKNDETDEEFWEDNPEKEKISPDHMLIISAAKKLLSSLNPAVVLSAVSYLFYCAPSSQMNAISRPLVRLLYESQIVSSFALQAIITIASKYPHIFVPHLHHFYTCKKDTFQIKCLKLKILSMLASLSNAELILNEFARCSGSVDPNLSSFAVRIMGKTALCNKQLIPSVLTSLLRLMSRSEGPVLSEAVIAMASILRLKRGTDDESQALKHLCRKFVVVRDPNAQAALLATVGDMHLLHPDYSPQLIRYVAQNFDSESSEVKLQALNLAAKLVVFGCESGVPLYLIKLCERDQVNYDISDRAKLLLALIKSKNDKVAPKLKELFSLTREDPEWVKKALIEENNFQIGTFSHFYNKEISGYDPLIDWAPENELPPNSVRHPRESLGANNGKSKRKSTKGKGQLDLDEIDVDEFLGNSEYEYEEEEEE